MSVYYTNELAFELPDVGFADRSVTVVDAVTGGRPCSMTVSRTPLDRRATLDELVDENVHDAAVRLPRHRVLHRRPSEVAGAPTIDVGAEWRGGMGMNYTRQAHLVVGGTWMLFSCNTTLEDRARCDAVMDHALATFRPRD